MGMSLMTAISMDAPLATRAAAAGARSRDRAALATVERACRYIESRREIGEGVVTLTELGAHCRMSPWHLQRLFKQIMGVTPRQYADAHRAKRLTGGKVGGTARSATG